MQTLYQLYSLATPNGQKVSILLEELQLSYEAHLIDISKGGQFTPEFIAINPNSKIPALIDPTGDKGKKLCIMESGAILVYLAEKYKKFISPDPATRSKELQWLFWQMGGAGPMFGQFGHFTVYADKKHDLSYGQLRYKTEAIRLLTVLDTQLSKHSYVASDQLSIADFAILPWITCLDGFYHARESLGLDQFNHINRWCTELLSRKGLQKGMTICSR
ncbi:glutathione S-transferase N-terminal domain-containing protein [Candidatus Comchoanobacter bicostacola]|uniref:Glutathione S-transferase N-terminal domain-containing protein n=1 Tax=Candidatus Comchoanobacter bicostacola TaxID=2919598 RepID=A0ABY5DLV0_9GAMM|nr:glutathione S-transferase N-terminal domain-containing protein [Candidatus Comchoanobacter bicostacola]UTC24908.1 glutathione S-transferase N-terminal domain-containing protein [Candidatus Comchoanobacter bicostacola]